MSQTKYHFRDRNPDMCEAWRKAFYLSDVEITCGNIFDVDVMADAVISPANSFGYMDGGIDAVYIRRFGQQLETDLQTVIQRKFRGELPVGQATIIPTNENQIKYVVSAPTMRIPSDVSGTVNAYLAMRAAILAINEKNEETNGSIKTVLCPGLATAIGRIPFNIAAQQMATAYRIFVEGNNGYHDRGFKIIYNHKAMTTGEAVRTE